MSVRKKDSPELYVKVQEQNLLRQYDLLLNCIEIGLKKGIEAFDKYTLWSLNAAAVANIAQFGGRYREGPIYVGNHRPPHFKEVPDEMDRFFSVIHENWTVIDHPTYLPAYALWRLNWIHPFVEGKWAHGKGSLLLPPLHATGTATAWQEDRARTYPGEPKAVLRCP
jgi:fido (protein-threonine AMPylation protein)